MWSTTVLAGEFAARLISVTQKICRPKAARSFDVGQNIAGVPKSQKSCRLLSRLELLKSTLENSFTSLFQNRVPLLFSCKDQAFSTQCFGP